MRSVVLSVLLGVVGSVAEVRTAWAQDDGGRPSEVIEVGLGGSSVVGLSGQVGRVTVTDPTIADASAASGGLLIVGRRVGETNLIMFGAGGQTTYLIKVTLPARAIQSELQVAFPKEDIEARAVGGSLVLVGSVSSISVLENAEQVALGYLTSPSFQSLGVEPKVINLLRVKQKQQVLVEVKFAEVTRKSIRAMDLNAATKMDSGRVAVGLGRGAGAVGGAAAVGAGPGAVGGLSEEYSMGTIFVGKSTGKFPFAAALNLLSERTLARTLAEPTLVAVSGQSASFLAGGEYPVPVSGTAFSAPTVEYKPVGVEMSFHPTVLDDDTIELVTTTQVTARDPTLDNGTLAGFKKRMSSTTIRLRDGQSFAVAGVLTDEMENTLRQMPGLGELPILGMLFSSKDFQRRQTELIVVVTARLAEPLDPGQLPPLPGQDRVNDPSDVELFLLNLNEIDEPQPRSNPSAVGGGSSDDVESSMGGASGRPVGPIGFWR